MKSFNFETLVGFFCVVGGVGSATALFWLACGRFDRWEVALFYLPIVAACAYRFGIPTAIWGAVSSFLCWDLLLRHHTAQHLFPVGDLIALIAFIIIAVTIAQLAGRARTATKEAEARAGEARMLYMVSQVIGREIDAFQLLQTLAAEVVHLCNASTCAILRCRPSLDFVSIITEASALAPSRERDSQVEQNAQRVLLMQAETLSFQQLSTGDSITRPIIAPTRLDGPAGGLYLPLLVDGNTLGLIYIGYNRSGLPFSFQDERLILTLASQAAVVMARDRLTREATDQAQKVAILGERNRLAKEVHDTLSHAFTGIRFLLEAASVSSASETPELISQARQLAIDGAQEARRSVWALRPVALEKGEGLVPAIRRLLRQQTNGTSIDGTLEVVGDERELTTDEEDNLLRISQEATTNVLRHSKATKVTVLITFDARKLTLSIADDGCGFSDDVSSPGFGLSNMRERSGMIDAQFCVKSALGQGTEVVVTVPFK